MTDSESEDNVKVRVYENKKEYKRKDGTIGVSVSKTIYKPNGKPRGKPQTSQSRVIAKVRNLSDKDADKVLKYIEKIEKK